MQRSEHRILTTHAGSLPRPAALTRLYAQRVRGEAVDPAEIEREGRAAVRAIVQKQIETGLDVIDDGEQSRESFVLYMRHRLTGLGGEGTRAMHADLDAYPQYKREFQARVTSPDRVSNRAHLRRRSVSELRGSRRDRAECAEFRAAVDVVKGDYVEAFLTAPSPGIIASIVQNRHYDTFERYVDALATALQVEYGRSSAAAFCLQLGAPTSRSSATLPTVTGRSPTSSASSKLTWCRHQQGTAQHSARQGAAACAGGNYEGPHDRDVALRDIWPSILRSNVGAFFLPFANPRHAHEFKLFGEMP